MAALTAARDRDATALHGGEEAELTALIVLSRAPDLTLRATRRLVDRYGGPARALRAIQRLSLDGLRERCTGRRPPTGETLRALQGDGMAGARRLLENARARGLVITGYGGDTYPPELNDLDDPPPVLFALGSRPVCADRAVAVVGTRAASSYGRRTAYGLGRELARWGWTVVSGMARGIDAAAHAGALDADGSSIGVLGTGHDHQYPADNRDLYARMRERGSLVSEFEPPLRPTRFTFPRRNRIIAALSRAVVVVEAGEKSGALNTSEHALDVGRDVLAVPGRIDDPRAAGCLKLLRQGAGLVTGARDVFDALGWLHSESMGEAPANAGGTSGEAVPGGAGPVRGAEDASATGDGRLLRALAEGASSPDELAVRLDLPVARILSGLGRLELEGWIERTPGGGFEPRRASGRARR